MALTISTGFVVDDAIVMIENIVRFIESGDPPMTAALKGAKQIGFTVVSLSLSLIGVFIPLIFMSGIVGRLFREFAITMSAAVVVSMIVSLTLTPMMCSRLLRPENKSRHGRLWHWSERFFQGFLALYERGPEMGAGAPASDLHRGHRHADRHDLALCSLSPRAFCPCRTPG